MCLVVAIMCAWCAKSTCGDNERSVNTNDNPDRTGSLQYASFYRGRLSNEVQNPVHWGNGGNGGNRGSFAKTPTTTGRTGKDVA